MRPRYLAVVGPAEDGARMARRDRIIAFGQRQGLTPAFETDNLLVLVGKGGAVHTVDGRGLVVGTLFPRAQGAPAMRDTDTQSALALGNDAPAALIGNYWGSYVAFLTDEHGGLQIVRAPFGELPCYYQRHDGWIAIASDVALLGGGGASAPAIDWRAVGRYLVTSELRQQATCLSQVAEVLGGMQLTIRYGTATNSTLWSPWDHVTPDAASGAMATAAAAVGATARDCVGRWGAQFDHVLVGVSGGLDSSIVATCLHDAGRTFSCMTLVTDDPLGDERHYARLLTEAVGRPLLERYRTMAGVDLECSNAAHLPRPVGRSFAQESERLNIVLAREIGADAIFRGGGGDNVFCYLQSVAPISDRLLTSGPGRVALETAVDICQLADCTLWTAGWRAMRRAWFRPVRHNLPGDTIFLAKGMADAANDSRSHPWLEAPPGALPGKAAHIALLLSMQNHMEGLAPAYDLPMLSPLMSQPLVECCLRIPSWLWCTGGHNRMVARVAFAAELPQAIIDRRSKGTPDSFVADIFDMRRAQIRELLGDGLLARHGLLDLEAVLAVIADTRPISTHEFSRIMQLVDVEAWTRAWA